MINKYGYDFSHLRVLLVDEAISYQVMMKNVFEKLNIEKYDIAENGIEAIVKTYRNQYDLIIMDNEIPFMTGFEVACIIKNKLDVQTPIYICSTSDTIDLSKPCKVCYDYTIPKPTEFDDVISMFEVQTDMIRNNENSK